MRLFFYDDQDLELQLAAVGRSIFLAGGHIRYHAHAAGLHVHETLAETVRAAASRG